MAQPSGQLLLDTGSPFYGYFWYANNTTTPGLWDARNGAMATKTGTGAITTESSANVANSNGSTYYTLGTPLTLSGDFTLGFRARLTSAGQAAMVMGDRTGLDHFVWLNNGSNELRLRALGNTVAVANGAATTLDTYYITRSSGTVVAYRNGTSLGTMGTGVTQDLVIRNLMDGYDSGTYALNGVAEFFHIIPGTAITSGQVTSLTSDPYQMLLGASSPTITADSGSFTVAGQDATLRRGLVLTADVLTMTVTGQEVSLIKQTPGAYVLPCDYGNFTIIGIDSYSDVAFKVDTGVFNLSGGAAKLKYSGDPVILAKNLQLNVGIKMGL